jgi:hypothetical protein
MVFLFWRPYLPDAPFSERVSFLPRRLGLCFLSESLGFLRQPIRKGQCVRETAALHGATPYAGGAGADVSLGHR